VRGSFVSRYDAGIGQHHSSTARLKSVTFQHHFPPESHARPTVRLVEIFHPTTFVRRPNEDTFAILGGTAPSGRRNGS
jgi:hypothetical protein